MKHRRTSSAHHPHTILVSKEGYEEWLAESGHDCEGDEELTALAGADGHDL